MNKYIVFIVIILLVASTGVFGYKYFQSRAEAQRLQKIADAKGMNSKIIDFEGLFIEKVLKADKEVSFDDRLQLENTVRALNDQEILEAWNAFVNSKNQDEAQTAVKNLLSLLVKKVRANE